MTEVMEKIVHFTISGEFITNQARSLWGAEDEQEKALDLLDCVEGLEDADKMAILTGKKKLVGDSSTGIDIEDDNVEEIHGCSLGLRDQFRRIHEKVEDLEITISDHVAGPQYIPSPWGLIPVPLSMTQRYNNPTNSYTHPGLKQGLTWEHPYFKVFEAQRNAEVKEKALDSLTGEEIDEDDEFDKALAAGREERITRVLDKIGYETPEPVPAPEPLLPVAPSQSRNGWIAPDGLYYPCEYSGHIRAAMRLGKEEYQLDDLGWVKVSDATDSESWDHNRPSILSKKDPTQSQLNTILDLCTAHGYKYDFDSKAGLGSDYYEDRL